MVGKVITRDWILIILPNSICINQNPSLKMRYMGFWVTNRSSNSSQKTKLCGNKKKRKKKRAYSLVEFAVPVDHRVKIKESKNIDKYSDLARELKKLWNMKVMVISVVIGVFGMVSNGLEERLEEWGIGGRIKTIHCWDWPEYSEESCRPR